MSSIDKIVKVLALSIGVSVVGVVGIWTGVNFYAHHNVSYGEYGNKVFQKVDGIFAYTQLEINLDGSVNIDRHSFGKDILYTDGEGDGNVDRIVQFSSPIVRGPDYRILYRGEDLKHNPVVFEDADRDFREQMLRFKPLINR